MTKRELGKRRRDLESNNDYPKIVCMRNERDIAVERETFLINLGLRNY